MPEPMERGLGPDSRCRETSSDPASDRVGSILRVTVLGGVSIRFGMCSTSQKNRWRDVAGNDCDTRKQLALG